MTERFFKKVVMVSGLVAAVITTQAQGLKEDLAGLVNTLQGTNSSFELTRGNTYPTVALPFGMNTWTPQTGKNGDGWKYQYTKNTIRGFQQAHQCSSWSNDYAVFSLMPVTGQLAVQEDARAAGFDHADEVARPDYYRVKLKNGITTEIAPTERGAHLRFAFPASGDAYVVLDGYTGLSGVKIIPGENKVIGYVRNGRQIPDNFRNYFILVFDKPFQAYGTWNNRDGAMVEGSQEAEGEGRGCYLKFKPGTTVQLRVASSYISPAQAARTWKTELGQSTKLEQTRSEAQRIWNKHLGKIRVEGGTDAERRTFYSCFFRASLFPRKFFEYDSLGKPVYYSPYNGRLQEGYMYTDTGFWDTFRAQFPLNAILYPEQHGQYMQALLAAYDQCGWLPSWSFPGEGGSMIGNHAISLLADAWAKGIRTFDPRKALDAYWHEASNKGPWGPANGRDGWKDYYTLGYVPYPEVHEATAKTLEYAYDDFCGYQLAAATGHDFYQSLFARQMYNYKNVYDPATGFMRGRNRQGVWRPNFDPTEWGGPFTEGSPWHWVWSVFHDVQGLVGMMGGDARFTAKLDSVFQVPNTYKVGTYGRPIHEMTEMVMANMGQYAHGNQPIQHMPYLYTYAGQPWKTQQHVREIMSRLYSATEDGYPGDEDQGQTSSWYVLSALGFYSVCPGTDQYVLGSPVFQKTTITLENGRQFVIDARNNGPQNVYIREAALNGKTYSRNFLRYADIAGGGVLHLEMADRPDQVRGTAPADRPFSLTKP